MNATYGFWVIEETDAKGVKQVVHHCNGYPITQSELDDYKAKAAKPGATYEIKKVR